MKIDMSKNVRVSQMSRGMVLSALAMAAIPVVQAQAGPVGFEGAIYVGTNRFDGNTIAAFGRNADGTLTSIGEFATGGNGAFFDGGEGLDPLISQNSLVQVDDRYLLAVNAGSDTVTSLRINEDFSLTPTDTASTGGVGPNSIAYDSGRVFVSNVDSDGVFTGPADQVGNITGFTFDTDGGVFNPIAGSTRQLRSRPSTVEFSPDGQRLVVSSWNAGAQAVPGSDATDGLVVYGVGADGSISTDALARAASTLVGNAEGRNLASVIGFAFVERDGEQYVVATEAREFPSDGSAASLPVFQTGSVSSFRLEEDGSLTPVSQDVLAGSGVDESVGQTSVCWIDFTPDGTVFYVANASGGSISSYSFDEDGNITLLEELAAEGNAALPEEANPLDGADGYIDLIITDSGEYLYQLEGLQGTIGVYQIDPNGGLTQIQELDDVLPPINTQGIVSVDRRDDGPNVIPTPSAALAGVSMLMVLMTTRRRRTSSRGS